MALNANERVNLKSTCLSQPTHFIQVNSLFQLFSRTFDDDLNESLISSAARQCHRVFVTVRHIHENLKQKESEFD